MALTDSPIVVCGEGCVEGCGVVLALELSGPASTSTREGERER